MALILAVLALVPWLALRSPDAVRGALRGVAAAVVAGLVVASPQLVAMVQQARAGGNGASAASLGYATWVASLPSLFAPSPRLTDDGLSALGQIYTSQTRIETLNTFGVVLSLLAVPGLVARWRGAAPGCSCCCGWAVPRWRSGRCCTSAATCTCRSPRTGRACASRLLMPYTWFIRVPGLSIFREADRLALLGLVGAALLAGRGGRLAGPAAGLAGDPGGGGARRAWRRAGRVPRGPPAHAHHVPGAGPADRRRSLAARSWSTCRSGWTTSRPMASSRPSQAILMATADGHPRAICYTSWVPTQTIAATAHHPFYVQLNQAQLGLSAGPGAGLEGPGGPADPARRLGRGVAARAGPGPVAVPVCYRLPLRLPGRRRLGLPASLR